VCDIPENAQIRGWQRFSHRIFVDKSSINYHSAALTTHGGKQKTQKVHWLQGCPSKSLVARPGFEPRQTEPKSVVLPLYYRAFLPSKGIAKIRPVANIPKYKLGIWDFWEGASQGGISLWSISYLSYLL
jgi:hypothetical protein